MTQPLHIASIPARAEKPPQPLHIVSIPIVLEKLTQPFACICWYRWFSMFYKREINQGPVLCFSCLALGILSICHSARGPLFNLVCYFSVHHLVPSQGYSVCDQLNLSHAVGALFYLWDSIRAIDINTSIYNPARTMAFTFSRSSVMACRVICKCFVEALCLSSILLGSIGQLPLSSVFPESRFPHLHVFIMI